MNGKERWLARVQAFPLLHIKPTFSGNGITLSVYITGHNHEILIDGGCRRVCFICKRKHSTTQGEKQEYEQNR
jgi:hypothetical protein